MKRPLYYLLCAIACTSMVSSTMPMAAIADAAQPQASAEQKAQAGRVLFSGKPGRGWGMGLALTHATLERLGGSLTLTERDGGGTRVRIALPCRSARS